MNIKNILILLFFTLFFAGKNTRCFALDKDADKIIKKYLKVIGGVKNWEKIRTIKIISQIKQSGDVITIIRVYEYVLDKGMRIETIINQGTPSIIGVNGKEGWEVINDSYHISKEQILHAKNLKTPISFLPDSIYKDYKFMANIPWSLINYKQKGMNYHLKEKKYLDGEEVYEVEASLSNQKIASYFFSTKNFYLLKIITDRKEYGYSDYREIGNLKYPYSYEEKMLYVKLPHSKLPVNLEYSVLNITFNSPVNNENMDKPMN